MPKLRTLLIAKSAFALVFCGGSIASHQSLAAEVGEPAEAFVAQLRSVGYFDTAIKYLDRIEKYPGVPQSFIDAIPLEKAQTFIDAALVSSYTERNRFFLSAEQSLKAFLSQTGHPRYSEAKLLLGKLQLVRANQLMSVADPSDEARENARKSCLDAAETFSSIVTDLKATLESMQGQKIDPDKEPDKVAQRDQYRYEFLQAQLRSGEAKQQAAQTYRDPAKDGKQLLEESLVSFTELSEKYSGYFQGAMSMLYRAQVQRTLGDKKSAIDSFQRVLEQPEVDLLRVTRMQAMTGLIEMQLAESEPKIDEIISQAKRLVAGSRPNERRVPEFAALQIALAKAYLFQSEKLIAEGKPTEGRKVASTNARPLLLAAAKVPGLHEREARDLLAKMGIEKAESAESTVVVEQPKSLDEAISTAQQLLQQAEELGRARELLADQLAKGGDGAEAAKAELDAADAQIDAGRKTLVQVLRGGLAIGGSEPEPLTQARQHLARVLYQRGDYRDAAAVGLFLSRSAANKPERLWGTQVAFESLKFLILNLPKESTAGLVRQFEVLGEHLAKTWPDDPRAALAKGILISLALDDDRWDDARKLLGQMPEGAELASFQRLMGQLLWNKSLLLRQENKAAEGDALLPQAAADLKSGLDGMPGELTGPEALQAALVLTRIEMRRGNSDEALKVLDHPKYGPVKSVEKLGEPKEGFLADMYAVELQAVVGVMTSAGSDTQALLSRATGVMDRLQATVKDKADANDRLVRIYIGMARDIKDQLDAASPDRKAKLIGAFRVFLDSIASSSKDPATLQWVGQTLMQMGESSLADSDPAAKQQGADLLKSSIQTFDMLLGQLGDQAPSTLKFQLGRANRLSGEYKKAIDLFEEILKASPMMLDTQIEAAKAYEQWAGTVDPKFAANAYRAALSGARPGADKKNVIWGWGRISQLVSGRSDFRQQFFEARYHVAFTRFMLGKVSNDTKMMEQASRDITQVAALYPDMGGAEQRKDFDLLMKEIQKGLGRKPAGLP